MKSHICLLILLLCLSLGIRAQHLSVPVDTFPYIHYTADTLVYDVDTSLMTHFFAKLDSAITKKDRKISILQIGGSHIQAGTMSHRIRSQLMNTFPDFIGERGLIFPYSAAPKCNNPSDYRVRKKGTFSLVRNVYKNHDKDLNTSGIAIYTSDTFPEIRIYMNDSNLSFTTQLITLICKPQPRENVPTIWIDSLEYFPIHIDTLKDRYEYEVIMKDSLLIQINTTGDSLEEFVLNGIYLGNKQPGLTFHSIGVNGASVDSYLRCVNFSRDLDLIHPDLVIFGIGINDAASSDFDSAQFKSNYQQLIQQFKTINPDCAFIFFTNNDSYRKISRRKFSVNKNALQVREVMYSLAATNAGAVFDQFEIMGGLTSMYKWYTSKLAKYDRVHFTNKGYLLMGDLFYNALIHAYNKYETLKQPSRPQ